MTSDCPPDRMLHQVRLGGAPVSLLQVPLAYPNVPSATRDRDHGRD